MPTLAQIAVTIQNDCACSSVRQASRLVTRLYDEVLRPTGLQSSQLPVLVALARFGENGARMSRLADVLGMDRTTLTRNVAPLEKSGLVRVARAPEDARARVLLLSKAGERTLEKAFPLWQRAQQRLRDLVGVHQTTDMRDRLGQLSARLQTAQARGSAP